MNQHRAPDYLCWLLWPLLAACGGGGGGSAAPTPIANPPQLQLVDALPAAGGAVALVADQPVSWQQLDGPTVISADWQQPLLAMDLPANGSYRFRATNSAGDSSDFQLEVNDEARLSARRDRIQPGGSRLSLRASAADEASDWQWQQVSGPSATLSSEGPLAFIQLPQVNSSQQLRFEVSAQIDGQRYSDQVMLIASAALPPATGAYFDEPLTSVSPWDSSSPYAAVLAPCLYSNQLIRSCPLATLPLLDMDGRVPSVDEVMARVVVSQRWMGDTLREFLLTKDPHGDFRALLGAVTGIVISSDIRPSFYWSATGAIYLDGDYLWRLAHERDLINEQPDYRSDYGKELAFDILWRYTRDNDYAFVRRPRSERGDRDLDELEPALAFLLYHELAHANDFFPPLARQSLSLSQSALQAATALADQRLSNQLRRDLPLASNLLRELAAISFRGASSSDSQRALQPEAISSEFASDGANDYYNYNTQYEDLAMLFEELMMSSRLGVRRDVAVTDQPQVEDPTAADYQVSWGQRGRISEVGVRERALWVAEQILPGAEPAELLGRLPPPTPLRSGASWLDNLNPSRNPQPRNLLLHTEAPAASDDRLRLGELR